MHQRPSLDICWNYTGEVSVGRIMVMMSQVLWEKIVLPCAGILMLSRTSRTAGNQDDKLFSYLLTLCICLLSVKKALWFSASKEENWEGTKQQRWSFFGGVLFVLFGVFLGFLFTVTLLDGYARKSSGGKRRQWDISYFLTEIFNLMGTSGR